MKYFCFVILSLIITLSYTQITVKKGNTNAQPLYDSLQNYRDVTNKALLVGQKIIFMPQKEREIEKGYYNLFTEPFSGGQLMYGRDMIAIPKDASKVYKPNPESPYYSTYKEICLSKWIIEDFVSIPPTEMGKNYADYLKLRNDKNEVVFYFCGMRSMDYDLLIEGYFMKLLQKNSGKKIITRKNVMLKDVLTNESLFSPANEIWEVKSIVISRLYPEDEAELFLLLINKNGNHIIAPCHIIDIYAKVIDRDWQFLFADLAWKKQINIADKMWQQLMEGKLEIGMTKQEVILSMGLLYGGEYKESPLAYFDEDEWIDDDSSLHIIFANNKVIQILNYKYQNIPTPLR